MNEFANKNYRLMLRETSYDIENNLPRSCMGEFHRNKEICKHLSQFLINKLLQRIWLLSSSSQLKICWVQPSSYINNFNQSKPRFVNLQLLHLNWDSDFNGLQFEEIHILNLRTVI